MEKTEKIEIRRETPADYRETESVTREAFWNQFAPGCCEHYLLHVMRDSKDFVPELDFVAVSEGKIIGNVVYAKGTVIGDDEKEYEVLTLGPISVLPEYQGRGVGKELIAYSRKVAEAMGFRAVFLCGDPAYYTKAGFVPAKHFRIRTEDNMYAEALQVFELQEKALFGITGRYIESSDYQIDEQAVGAFDKLFPLKEAKAGTPSQKRFEEICTLRVPYEK